MDIFDFNDMGIVRDRTGTDAVKWQTGGAGDLPMWVADMDLMTSPAIRDALIKRASHPVYGYTSVSGEWKDAYIGRWKNAHGFSFSRDEIIFVSGVVPAISSIVRRITSPGDKIIILTPVYNMFFNSIINNGRTAVECPLVFRGEDSDGRSVFDIDFDLLEELAGEPKTTMLIFCNPQNPIGRIWDRESLLKVGEICAANGLKVISDEIHCDITEPGKGYIPFASVSDINRDISVTCLSPSKAFNTAGIHSAAVVIGDPVLRRTIDRGLNNDEIAEPNVFATEVAIAAYTRSGEWLDALNRYISGNKRYVREYLRENIPLLKDRSGDATYLCWIDISDLLKSKNDPEDKIGFRDYVYKKTGLYLSDGKVYGEGGKGYVRLNAACPEELLRDGMERLRKAAGLYGVSI